MRTSSLIKLLVVIVIVVALGFLLFYKPAQSPTDTSTVTPTPTPTVTETANATTTASYTLVEVAKHNNESSCWTTINGGVYDVTKWIGQHPGGRQTILSLCGKDGTEAFNDQHGGQGRPEAALLSFKIGVLAK